MLKKRITIISFGLAMLAACASDTGVVPVGQEQFIIEKQQATGFPGLGNLRAEVYVEANEFCAMQGGSLETVRFEQTDPPYILGNYPRVSLTFSCN
ncbi:hypothetical protein [Yoonia sp.]|uniref:hypothetical protein n=1 Tax=Yoonia sp. TaxID=2212373 RepID=UPI002E0922B6|nr:hypothetical protein [Yoonia sp.]